MSTYQIPRNTKGEGRILYIFSTKALIYTIIGGGIGFFIYVFFKSIGLTKPGLVIMLTLAGIGFSIATFKIPEIKTIRFTTQVAGLKIDEVIIQIIKYKLQKKKHYIYIKEENNNDR